MFKTEQLLCLYDKMAEAGKYLLKSPGPTSVLNRDTQTRFLRVISSLVLSISQDRDSFGQPMSVFDEPYCKKKYFLLFRSQTPSGKPPEARLIMMQRLWATKFSRYFKNFLYATAKSNKKKMFSFSLHSAGKV